MINGVTYKDIFEFVNKYFFGTVSTKLMTLGITLVLLGIPGFFDYAMYAYDLYMEKPTKQPSPAFEWPQYLGSLLFLIGGGIKLYTYIKEQSGKSREARTTFKENYKNLTDELLQDEFEKHYGVKYASVKAIKNVLGHKDNKNLVIALFEKGHPHIEVSGEWFKIKSKALKIRYNVGFLFWTLLPMLSIATLMLGLLEIFYPGITDSGSNAVYVYLVMLISTIAGAYVMWQDLISMGRAITLVNDYKPHDD